MAGLQMRPAGSDPIFDRVAGQLVVDALANREEGYLQEKVLPVFSAPDNVTVNGKTFPNIPAIGRIRRKGASFGQAGIRSRVAPGEPTPRIRGVGTDTIDYELGTRRLAADVNEDDLDVFATNAGIDAYAYHLQEVVNTLMVEREAEVSALYSTPGNWTAPLALAGATCWAGAGALGDPLVDLANQKLAIQPWCKPNTIIMGRQTAYALSVNNAFRQFMATTMDRGLVTDDGIVARLKSLLGVDHVFIADTSADTSLIVGTVTLADIWGDMLWMGRLPISPDGTMKTLGTFNRQGMAGVVENSATYLVDRGGWLFDDFEDRDREIIVPRVKRRDAFGIMRPELGTLNTNTVV